VASRKAARGLALALAIGFVSSAAPGAEEQPSAGRVLYERGAARIIVRPAGQGEELVARQGEALLHQTRSLRFWLRGADGPLVLDAAGTAAVVVIGWNGGADCCSTLHLFAETSRGLVFAGQVPFGKGEPSIESQPGPDGAPRLAFGDAAFDLWDGRQEGSIDLRPPMRLRWDGAGLRADPAAMRREVAAVLAEGCAPPHAPWQPNVWQGAAGLEAAAAAIRGEWAGNGPVQLAQLAVCLVYAGQPAAARQVMAAAWPPALPGRQAVERKIAGRLACSPWAAAVRDMAPVAERWPPAVGCARR